MGISLGAAIAASSSAAKWSKVYRANFAVTPAHDFLTTPTAVIAGAPWTIFNAGAASQFEIVGGELVVDVDDSSSTRWIASSRTCPGIEADLSDLIPGLDDDGDEYRVLLGLGVAVPLKNWQYAGVAAFAAVANGNRVQRVYSGGDVVQAANDNANTSTGILSLAAARVLELSIRGGDVEARAHLGKHVPQPEQGSIVIANGWGAEGRRPADGGVAILRPTATKIAIYAAHNAAAGSPVIWTFDWLEIQKRIG